MKDNCCISRKNKLTVLIILIISSLIGLSGCFLSGSFSEKNQIECISDYITSVVNKNTLGKKYSAVTIDAPDKGGPYYSDEFATLFDVFKTGVVSFTSGMNVNKEFNIHIDAMNTENLSLMFLGPIGSAVYKSGDKTIIRHHMYNIETMFEDPQYNKTDYDFNHCSVAYISLEQANNYLEFLHEEKDLDGNYSIDQYKKIIQQPINVSINGEICAYYIWNIYFNKGFYCEGLKEILGEYILTSYYQPMKLRNNHKLVYFFNEYSYYNKFMINYINNRFENEPSIIGVVKNNIIGNIDENYYLSFYLNNGLSSQQLVFNILIALSIFVFLSSSVLFLALSKKTIIFDVIFSCLIFLPYLSFKCIYLITNKSMFYSEFSCKLNAFLILFYFIALFIKLFKRFGAVKTNTQEMFYNEINI